MTSRISYLILILLLFTTGCTINTSGVNLSTTTPFVVTSTLPPLPTSAASETPLPAPPQPTVAPVEGTTSTQINVRAEPSTSSNVLGIIAANTRVEILGKDPGGNWLQILYQHAQAVDGKGWITAQYVSMAAGTEVPVIGGDSGNPDQGIVAIVQQQINVRSGPGTSFNSLGTLNAQDVINLIGKDSNGTWLQIEFAAGPDGKGWVNAAFVQTQGVENLPIVSAAGAVVGTGTPTGIPYTPTSTVIPARADNDSPDHPGVSVVFEPLGTQTLIYSGDVSSPDGDPGDWIQFTPYNNAVFASLECIGTSSIQVNVLENGLPSSFELACGNRSRRVIVQAGSTYLVEVQAPQMTEGLQYSRYTITIDMNP